MGAEVYFCSSMARRPLAMLAVVLIGLLAGRAVGQAAAPGAARPPARAAFEADAKTPVPNTPIDQLVAASLQARGLKPAPLCSDEVFIRRLYVDVLGALPKAEQVLAFVRDAKPDKRARLIDAVLDDPRFADRWSLKWCDILRVKAEFPINLWPNAVQAYHYWIHAALRDNMPYDQFARALLTSSGSNFRVPPVNFYRAIQGREPANLAGAVALTFMGSRIDTWPVDRRRGLEAVFSRVAYKPTAEWKEEIVLLNPAVTDPLEAVLPDGSVLKVAGGDDPRRAFADWLIRPDNPYFAQAIVNRVWSWLLGRGIVHDPDDIRPDNPPVNPALLRHLAGELTRNRYDLKHIYRSILNSRTYQQSSIPAEGVALADGERHFACYTIRRLDAEILQDALDGLFGAAEGYSSPIPEPFTYIPAYQRAVELADGSITSGFLELFGRPARDSGQEGERNNEVGARQRLYLLNSSQVQRKIERSSVIRNWIAGARGNDARLIESIYLAVLSRRPTAGEVATAQAYLSTGGQNRQAAALDLTWALVNSREFLYRH